MAERRRAPLAARRSPDEAADRIRQDPRLDGRHNRIGYLDVDESSSSSESGDEEPDVADDVDRADD